MIGIMIWAPGVPGSISHGVPRSSRASSRALAVVTPIDSGVAFERAAEPHNIQRVTVVEIDGDRAVVQECVVDDGLVVSRDTGEVVDDSVSTHNVQAEMLRVDGVWKVSEARLLQQFEGVAGCALAS